MFIHHSMCIVGIYTSLCEGISCNYIVMALYVSEISNPIMHCRMIVKHLGMRYTKLYEILELTYVMLYVYGRVILGTSVVIKTSTCQENNYIVRLISIGIALQSYFYISRMFINLRNRALEYSERKEKGVKLRWLEPLTK